MIPDSLTASQECIPDLTERQLEGIGYETNHLWKLNAKMLGYTDGMDLDDFIDALTDKKIQTYKKGKHVAIFCFNDPVSPDEYPLALDGNFIIQQKFETCNGAWIELDIFSYRKDLQCILGSAVSPELTGRFHITYGKYIEPASPQALKSYGFKESCENIEIKLKDMDLKEKEMRFIDTNKLQSPKIPASKNGRISYRISKNGANKGGGGYSDRSLRERLQ